MNSKIQIMDVTNKTFLFRNRDDIFLIGDIDIGYPVQLDFKLSTTGKKSKWRFNTARVSVCRCKETQYDDWDNSLDFTGKLNQDYMVHDSWTLKHFFSIEALRGPLI